MALRGRRPNRRWVAIAIVVGVVLALASSARFYTDVLWFREVGLSSVLWKSLGTQFGLGAGVGVLGALLLWGNLTLAARVGPTYRIGSLSGRDPIEMFREQAGPYLKWIRLAVAGFFGLVTGLSAAASWRTFLLFVNRVSFGQEDPQFGRDIGFYVFELPFYDLVLSWLWFALLATLLLTIAAHYLQGSIRPEQGLRGVQSGALAHISVLLGLVALVRAAQYFLGQYELNFSEQGVVTGASYTDVTARLPALRVLAVISVLSAILFLINIVLRRVSLPLAAVGIWILFAFLAGGVWPWWVQRFSVAPQELQRESEYILRNLAATREAFGLADVERQDFAVSQELGSTDISANTVLLQNVRLWDPEILQQAYLQLQSLRPFYEFPDVDIDRYEIGGQKRQVLLAPRELSLDDLPEGSRSWANLHLQYTHGYGLVASPSNGRGDSGQPTFLVKDVPGTVAEGAESLEVEEPRLYYGEGFADDEYSVVNTDQPEVDFPAEDDSLARTTYAGEGGVPLGNLFQRVAFAVRESDPNLVLSNLINDDSRILLYRNVRDRVLRAAPFLALDHDPYVAAVDGRLKWVLDAYTSTSFYPYSQRFDMGDIVGSTETGSLDGQANYLRNSVKVVVDAYDGTMQFYVIDDNDPLIQAWRNAFPDLFTDEEPSDNLQEHFRYPEDLFNVQSEVYLTYHMTDPSDFYARGDEWSVPTAATGADQESNKIAPTYLLIRLPGSIEDEFVLTRPFTPRTKANMIAIMLARSDPDHYGELLTLQLPRQRTVLGPAQVDNLINQDVEISEALTLLGQQGSEVSFGSLVILPIEESILYVQPLFVTAENAGIPELKRVVMVFDDEVVMGDTFADALTQLFDLEGDEGAPTDDQPDDQPPDEAPPDDGEEPDDQPPDEGEADPRLERIVERAGRIYERAQEALAEGDFETYARLIEQLGRLLAQAEALSN